MTYLETTAQFYSEVAQTPQVGLCCVQTSSLQLAELHISLLMERSRLQLPASGKFAIALDRVRPEQDYMFS